ncbi:MAG: tetratricopeptide repeat protein, partial [Pseudomonadota bacterium]
PTSPTELPHLLTGADNKDILLRILRNLKAIYAQQQAWDKVLIALNRMLLIAPDSAAELRDRGELHERLECFRAALEDFRQYLRLQPRASDAFDIRRRLVELDARAARLN